MHTLLISFSKPFDSTNHNRKRMKPKITHLIEAQQCEIIAMLSKPNAPSKWATFYDANNEEYCVVMMRTLMKFWKRCELKNHLSMMKCSLSRHLMNLKVLPTAKALKLYTSLSSTSKTNCFAPMVKRKLDICMMNCNNCLRPFNKTFTN